MDTKTEYDIRATGRAVGYLCMAVRTLIHEARPLKDVTDSEAQELMQVLLEQQREMGHRFEDNELLDRGENECSGEEGK